jgi:hypothetical protein
LQININERRRGNQAHDHAQQGEYRCRKKDGQNQKDWQKNFLEPGRVNQFQCSTENGNNAIFLALLIAVFNCLWCVEQLPEILEGTILPLSEINGFNTLMS